MGRNGCRYTIEEKLYYIDLVKQHKMTPHAVQARYGVNDDQIRQWISRYEVGGPDGLRPRPLGRYSKEFKLQIVLEYLAGHTSYPRLCQKYDISNVSTVYQWVHRYTSGKAFTTRRVKPLKNGRKTTQIERIEIAQWVIAHDLDYYGAVEKYNVSYGQVYSWAKKFQDGGESSLVDRRGKGKTAEDQLTREDRLDLKVKQLNARIEYLSTENATLKKLQEMERRHAPHKTSTKQSKR